jgi:hypothetical protein
VYIYIYIYIYIYRTADTLHSKESFYIFFLQIYFIIFFSLFTQSPFSEPQTAVNFMMFPFCLLNIHIKHKWYTKI